MGVEIIRWLQTYKLDPIMEFFTMLGGVYFIVAGVVIFTIASPYRGALLGCFLFFTLITNNLLKGIIALPRPFVLYPDVYRFVEPDYSFPSGHSMCGALFWIGAALLIMKSKRMLIPAILVTVGIGISRCYFGVHYPTDVLVGWILGSGMAAWAYLIARPHILSRD